MATKKRNSKTVGAQKSKISSETTTKKSVKTQSSKTAKKKVATKAQTKKAVKTRSSKTTKVATPKKREKLDLEDSFAYCWKNPKRLLYSLWILVPIFGWFALAGYIRKLVVDQIEGNFKEVPAFGDFWENFTDGLLIVILSIIPSLLYGLLAVIVSLTLIGIPFVIVIYALVGPVLTVHFMKELKMSAWFEVGFAWNMVFKNFEDYILVFIFQIIYGIAYAALTYLIIGFPGAIYGRLIHIADFYGRMTNK